jgi:hypothetical protein
MERIVETIAHSLSRVFAKADAITNWLIGLAILLD